MGSSGGLIVAENLGNIGSYSMSGGTLTTGEVEVGIAGGLGTFTQSGNINITSDFMVGQSGGSGSYSLNNGQLSANREFVGQWGGSGLFIQSGGSNSTSTFLDIGTDLSRTSTDTGSYTLSGTGVLYAAAVNVGFSNGTVFGTGVLNITGGRVTITNALTISNNAGTAVNFSGGTLSVGSLITGGIPSNFYWTSGALTVTGTSGLAISAPGPAGSTLTLTSSKSLAVTYALNMDSTGILTLNSGILSAGSITGTGTLNDLGGSFELPRSTSLNTLNLSNNLTLSRIDGVFNAVNVWVSGTSTAKGNPGVLTVSAGTMYLTGTLKVWDRPFSNIYLTGGSITANSLDVDGNYCRFHWTGGQLNLTNLTINDSDPDNDFLLIGAPKVLNISGTLTIAPGKTITLTAGGTINAGVLNTAPAGLIWDAGTLNLTNSSLAGNFSAETPYTPAKNSMFSLTVMSS